MSELFYVCNWPVKENGETLHEGDEYQGDNTAQLLELGAIRLIEGQPQQPAATTEPSEENTDGEALQLQKVIYAIGQLEKGNEAHWTKTDKPEVKPLTEIVGFKVSAALRDQAWDSIQAESEEGEQ